MGNMKLCHAIHNHKSRIMDSQKEREKGKWMTGGGGIKSNAYHQDYTIIQQHIKHICKCPKQQNKQMMM
jgi:hypothetical protein